MADKIFDWYNQTTEPKPKITEQVLIDKYLEIVAQDPEPPYRPTLDDKLNEVFN